MKKQKDVMSLIFFIRSCCLQSSSQDLANKAVFVEEQNRRYAAGKKKIRLMNRSIIC